MLHSPARKTDMMLMDGVKMFKEYKKAYLAPDQLYLRFGENIRALRREKHLSQEELDEMVFTTQKCISCIETGCAHPKSGYMPANRRCASRFYRHAVEGYYRNGE